MRNAKKCFLENLYQRLENALEEKSNLNTQRETLNYLTSFILTCSYQKAWESIEGREFQELISKIRSLAIQLGSAFEKELARSCIGKKGATGDYYQLSSRKKFCECELLEINKEKKLLLVGSGAYPETAFALMEQYQPSCIQCVDCDSESIELSQCLAKKLGYKNIYFEENYLEKTEMSCFDCILIASLVDEKQDFLDRIFHEKSCLKENSKVVVRYGNSIKSLFNFPLRESLLKENKDVLRMIKIEDFSNIYDSIVLEEFYE